MINTILVPLDGFSYSEQVIPRALAIAKRWQARVHLVHAIDLRTRPPYSGHVTTYDWWNGDAVPCADDYLRNCTVVFRDAGVPVTWRAMIADPVPFVMEEAERVCADLIVMSTHGRGPIRRMLLGSVADELANQSSVPVMFIKAREGEFEVLLRRRIGCILVPLDGTATAEAALEPAIEIAKLEGGWLTLLNVDIAVPSMLAMTAIDPSLFVPVVDAGDRVAASEYMGRMADYVRERGVVVITDIVNSLSSADVAIRNYANEHEVDMIVFGTKGHSLLRSLLGASVSERAIRHVDIPVVVVHPSTAVTAEEMPPLHATVTV